MFARLRIPVGVFALALLPMASLAKFSFPGCADLTEQDFNYVKVVTKTLDPSLTEPVKMAFAPVPGGSQDALGIYFVERGGKAKYFDPLQNKVAVIGQLNVFTGSEQGLVGIALDPGFQGNHWLYLYYTPAQPSVFRLSRFTLRGGSLDMATEKVLVDMPAQRQSCCHTGGGMAFDAAGDLWLSVGNNSPDNPNLINETDWAGSAEASAGNPSDLRGGVLRIHPDNSPKGYSIPKGNFGEYWSAQFAQQGKTELAAQYADPVQTLPEIYVKGSRSPYSLTVDPYRRWVTWGEFGPGVDRPDEHNLITHPVFAGYPYFAGPNSRTPAGKDKDVNAPVNPSKWDKGPRQLPPATGALHAYGGRGGTTGPIYRYDGLSPSKVKFPPHFDKAWFVTDFSWTGARIFQVSDDGSALLDSLRWFDGFGFNNPLDFQQGPDGALYVLNYAGWYGSTPETHIGRIEYRGNCRPAMPQLPAALSPLPNGGSVLALRGLRMDGGSVAWEAVGPLSLSIRDMRGRRVFSADVRNTNRVALPGAWPRRGIFLLDFKWAAGSRTYRVTLI